jgi:hypothetical protein
MTYVFKDTALGKPPIASHLVANTGAGPKVPGNLLGTIVEAVDSTYGAGEFIYLKGAANTVLGSWVTYNSDDWSTTLAVADAVGPVAVAMAPCVANEYGWYQISGKAAGKVLAGFVDNATPYLTSTAGSLDDTAVAGDYVFNAKGASAIDTPSTGLAEFEISRPFVKNGIDDAVT